MSLSDFCSSSIILCCFASSLKCVFLCYVNFCALLQELLVQLVDLHRRSDKLALQLLSQFWLIL